VTGAEIRNCPRRRFETQFSSFVSGEGRGGFARVGHVLRWVAPLCVFRRGNSGFGGWGTSQYHLKKIYCGFAVFERSVTLLPSRWDPLRTPLFGAPATGAAVRAGHVLRWVAPLCVFRRENLGFGGWVTNACTPSSLRKDMAEQHIGLATSPFV
jgi:hypothetical protein